jgi:hypothetical protein
VEGGFLTFVGFHISLALEVLFKVGVVPVYCCVGVVFTFVDGESLVIYFAFSYSNVVAICLAVAGWLSSTYLARISSSVSISSSGIVSSVAVGVEVFFCSTMVVLGFVCPGSSAVQWT